jgi:hypothetical protein
MSPFLVLNRNYAAKVRKILLLNKKNNMGDRGKIYVRLSGAK